MGRGKKEKRESDVFSKETFGMVLILFSTLALVCLFTREAVFSTVGQAVNGFLLGVFGWFAFPFFFWAIVMGVYLVAGLGTFSAGANGTLAFAYDPQAGAAAGPASAAPAGSAVETEASGEPAADRTVASGTGGSVGSDAVGRGRTPRYEPDPCVKGLTYGRPVKTTDAYTFVGSKPARRIDAFLIVAIVAALLAVGVIVYGYVNDRRAKQMQAELMEEVSQSAAAGEAAAESVAE